MPTHAGTGLSKLADPRLAGREAAQAARAGLRGRAPQFCLVFATSGHDPAAVLAGVRDVVGDARIAGCSAEGVIAGDAAEETFRVVSVLAVHSDRLQFEPLLVRDYGADPALAGSALAAAVRERWRGDELALLVLPDGLRGNAGEMLAALDRGLPARLPVVGGAASDALVFERTTQFHGDTAASDSVAAVLLRGKGGIEIAVSHGCQPIGIERRITGANGPWVQSIDGQPAWSVFRQYLEGDPEDLNTEGAIYLSVGQELPPELAKDHEALLIRTPMALDKPSGALYFPGGDLDAGTAIRLTRRDPDRIRATAVQCAERIQRRRPQQPPAFVLQFDCAGRGKQLYGSGTAEALVRPLRRVLGRDVPWLGFYTYGEIAPIGGTSCYHNFTVALCAVYDQA